MSGADLQCVKAITDLKAEHLCTSAEAFAVIKFERALNAIVQHAAQEHPEFPSLDLEHARAFFKAIPVLVKNRFESALFEAGISWGAAATLSAILHLDELTGPVRSIAPDLGKAPVGINYEGAYFLYVMHLDLHDSPKVVLGLVAEKFDEAPLLLYPGDDPEGPLQRLTMKELVDRVVAEWSSFFQEDSDISESEGLLDQGIPQDMQRSDCDENDFKKAARREFLISLTRYNPLDSGGFDAELGARPASLYERALNERTLHRLEVERTIALALLREASATFAGYRSLPKNKEQLLNIIEEVSKPYRSFIATSSAERKEFDLLEFVYERKQATLKMYQYYLKVLLVNRKWLLDVLTN